MKHKPKPLYLKKQFYLPIVIVTVIAGLVLAGFAGRDYHRKHYEMATKSKLAYIDGSDALDEVSGFYREYTHATGNAPRQEMIVKGFGNDNLLFYYRYYQHGFDPITCSTQVPVKVMTKLDSTGPVAYVSANATYPDTSTQTMEVRVTLTDSLRIDAITCPAPKAGLLPGAQA